MMGTFLVIIIMCTRMHTHSTQVCVHDLLHKQCVRDQSTLLESVHFPYMVKVVIVKCTNIIHVQDAYCTVLYNIVVHMSIIAIVNGASIILLIDDHSQWGKVYVYTYTSCDTNILWLCIINSFW